MPHPLAWDLARNSDGTWRLAIRTAPDVLRVLCPRLTDRDLDALQDTLHRGRVLGARRRPAPPVLCAICHATVEPHAAHCHRCGAEFAADGCAVEVQEGEPD